MCGVNAKKGGLGPVEGCIVAKFQGPKFRKRADTSFKFLALILFEIWHLQNFIPLFVKGP